MNWCRIQKRLEVWCRSVEEFLHDGTLVLGKEDQLFMLVSNLEKQMNCKHVAKSAQQVELRA